MIEASPTPFACEAWKSRVRQCGSGFFVAPSWVQTCGCRTRSAAGDGSADTEGASRMNGQVDQRTVLLALVGCGTVYVALEHPQFGTALMVGVGVVTLIHLLMRQP